MKRMADVRDHPVQRSVMSFRGRGAAVLLLLVGVAPCLGAQVVQPEVLGVRTQSASTQGASREGALFLLLPVGAQGVGMGRAVSALPTQEGAFWNPAALAWTKGGRALLYRGEHVAGEATAMSVIVQREGMGAAGASYQLLDVGDQDLTDEQGQVRGSISVRSHLGVVSFAAPILSRLSAGINFKVVQFRVGCRGECREQTVTATTYAVDLGVQGVPFAAIPLRLGGMVAHLGPRLQVDNAGQADPLPTRVRLSAAYELLNRRSEGGAIRLWLTAEGEDRPSSPGRPSLYFGSELSAGDQDLLYVRGGYVLGEMDQPDGAAVGVGVRFDRLDLGIARSLGRPAIGGGSEPVHITLGFLF